MLFSTRRILREVKQSGEIYIVLDCDVENVVGVLREAKAVGMMTAYHNYLITNLDLHLADLDQFKYSGTNITAFRLVDPFKPRVQVCPHADLPASAKPLELLQIDLQLILS